ncbi:MAG: ABC transporter ATP-binding protein/permease [Roseburia sp.]|nr:ABC transporter ATP-binding protein/permease [Ruminococcus sp.]MCM1153933.1 ABC transporter ATP-binding protein/permease [Roseburia sp.]MCM1242584.1 ABC transporter ATP-binding protein/permease [Roseburia sp.]
MFSKLNYIFTAKDKVKIFFLMIAVVIGSFLELLAVSVFSPFIDLIMNPEAIDESGVISYLYTLFSFQSIEYFLAFLAGGIIVIYVVKDVYTIVEKNAIYKFSYRIQRTISTDLLKAYMKEPYTFHLNNNISVLQRSMQEDTDQFAKGIIHLMEMVAEICVCIAIGIYLYIVSHSITVIVVGLLILCLAFFSMISKKYSSAWGREGQQHKSKIYQWMNQSLGGIKEIKVLNREESFIEHYDGYFARYVRVLRLNRLIGVVPKYIIEMVSMMGLLLAVIFKIFFGQKDLIDFVPQLAVFAVAAFRLLPSVGRINEHLSAVLYAMPSLELIYNDLREVEELNISADAGTDTQGRNEAWKLTDRIEVKDVTYRYPDGDTDVIEHADFVIQKGQTAAFIGASGAGKSTMADILLGLLKPQYGKIYADGMNVYKNLSTWQKEIGYIPQTIYLSDDTIRNNVAFGIDEKEIDEQAVVNALKQAQLYDFVDSLPEGLDTFVGDRGVRLSGGQRQRIGIARALYHDPEILILDEATSALDNDTESAVMEAIEHLHGEKTMIIIAHRLTTIRNADVIYEVGDGRVESRKKEDVLK